jgi:hypothetical protein
VPPRLTDLAHRFVLGRPPPADYVPTPAEAREVAEALVFSTVEIGPRMVIVPDNPHRRRWLAFVQPYVR